MTIRHQAISAALAVGALWTGERATGHATQDSATLLRAAREAIGGQALVSVRTLELTGEALRRNQEYRAGDPTIEPYVPVPFHISILFPDYYRGVWTMMPSGKELVVAFRGDQALAGVRVVSERNDFVRLMLALLLKTDTAIPLRLDDRSPISHRLAFTGADGFAASVELDRLTRVPRALRFAVRMLNGPASGEVREWLWTLEDRRTVGGVSVPHRIIKTSGRTHEETWAIKRIVVNPSLKPSDFGVAR